MNSQEQSGSKGAFTSYKNPMICDQQLEFLLQGANSCQGRDEDGHCPDHDVFSHVLSSFELPNPTLSAQQQNNIVLGEPISLGVDKGQSSKHASDVDEYQQRESDEDDNSKEDKSNSGNRPQKRRRSAEMHNLTERLRRQRIKEKMKALQDLIPNCNKRDKTSTLDDAITYIRTLQYQVQMMSIGAGFTMWHSPWMLPPHQPGQQGVQIPRHPALPQTGPAPGLGVGYGMDPSSWINIPMRMPNNPCSFPSATTSGSMGIHGVSDVQLFQNSDKDMGNMSFSTSSDMSCAPFQATSNLMFRSQCTNQGE